MSNGTADGGGRLRRELGLLHAVGVGLGAVMGAGLFVVTGLAAAAAGPALLLGLLFAGLAAACNGLSSAQLAARFPQSGGTYEYGHELLHPVAGFAAGWMFLASKLAAAGTVALGFGHHAAALLPGTAPKLLAAVAVTGVTAANLLGIRRAGTLNLAVVTITLGALGAFLLAGAAAFEPERLVPFAPQGWRGVAESSALLFFAYTGYARLATLGEEVRDPARTIPRAIVATLALSFAIYFAVCLVALGAVGADALAASRTPLEDAARHLGGPGLGFVVGAGAAAGMLGVLLSQVLGVSRMMLAMARRGDLPAALGRVDPARGVPGRAVTVTGLLALALALAGSLEDIVAAAAFTILLYYALTNAAALRLPPPARRFPPWIAWAGLAACVLLAASLRAPAVISGLALLAAGLLLRAAWRRWLAKPLAGGR